MKRLEALESLFSRKEDDELIDVKFFIPNASSPSTVLKLVRAIAELDQKGALTTVNAYGEDP